MDIGTPERYLQASWDILEGTVATELDGRGGPSSPTGSRSRPMRASPSAPCCGPARHSDRRAAIAESVLLDDCRIGPGAEIRGSILAAGVAVGGGVRRFAGASSARARGSRPGPRSPRGPDSARRGRRGGGPRVIGLAEIRAIDPSNQLDDVLALPDHLRDALWRVESAGLEPAETRGLIVCGMGGSAIGGSLARAAMGDHLRMPMQVFRDYELPRWTDSRPRRPLCQLLGRHRGNARLLRRGRGRRGAALRRHHRRRPRRCGP